MRWVGYFLIVVGLALLAAPLLFSTPEEFSVYGMFLFPVCFVLLLTGLTLVKQAKKKANT